VSTVNQPAVAHTARPTSRPRRRRSAVDGRGAATEASPPTSIVRSRRPLRDGCTRCHRSRLCRFVALVPARRQVGRGHMVGAKFGGFEVDHDVSPHAVAATTAWSSASVASRSSRSCGGRRPRRRASTRSSGEHGCAIRGIAARGTPWAVRPPCRRRDRTATSPYRDRDDRRGFASVRRLTCRLPGATSANSAVTCTDPAELSRASSVGWHGSRRCRSGSMRARIAR